MMTNPVPHTDFKPVPRLRIFASMMYESILLFGVVFFADYLLTSFVQSTDPGHLLGLHQAVLFIVIGLYFIICWKRIGQTLPMKTWHIGLVNKVGGKPSLAQYVVRYICAWIIPLLGAWLIQQLAIYKGWNSIAILIVFAPFLNFVYSWLDPKGAFLHDRLAGTQLVDLKAKNL